MYYCTYNYTPGRQFPYSCRGPRNTDQVRVLLPGTLFPATRSGSKRWRPSVFTIKLPRGFKRWFARNKLVRGRCFERGERPGLGRCTAKIGKCMRRLLDTGIAARAPPPSLIVSDAVSTSTYDGRDCVHIDKSPRILATDSCIFSLPFERVQFEHGAQLASWNPRSFNDCNCVRTCVNRVSLFLLFFPKEHPQERDSAMAPS